MPRISATAAVSSSPAPPADAAPGPDDVDGCGPQVDHDRSSTAPGVVRAPSRAAAGSLTGPLTGTSSRSPRTTRHPRRRPHGSARRPAPPGRAALPGGGRLGRGGQVHGRTGRSTSLAGGPVRRPDRATASRAAAGMRPRTCDGLPAVSTHGSSGAWRRGRAGHRPAGQHRPGGAGRLAEPCGRERGCRVRPG